jgi:hypothetical protein
LEAARLRPARFGLAGSKPEHGTFLVELVDLAVDPTKADSFFNGLFISDTGLARRRLVADEPDTLGLVVVLS